jgi:hypothetical protein
VFNLANGPISWVGRNQRTVTVSSTESEYVNLSEAFRESTLLSRIMKEITSKESPVIIYNDSQLA